jgi:hypothetical protein
MTTTNQAPAPVALVHGFLGPNTSAPREHGDTSWHPYWGSAFEAAMPNQRIFVLTPSGVASLHDRAVQLFYQLKGGQVDYGAEHSECFGHARFGRMVSAPKFAEWDAEHPVHLVGHSFGGPTVRMLQHLLAQGDVFPGHETCADWVLSITTISAPNNGSLAVYTLGARTQDAPRLHKVSPGYFLGTLVVLAEWLDVDAFRRYVFDFQMEYWNHSRKSHGWGGLKRWVKGLFSRNDLFEGADNAAYDMTVHAMSKWNTVFKTNTAGTYYLNVMAYRHASDLPSPSTAPLITPDEMMMPTKPSTWPSGWTRSLSSCSLAGSDVSSVSSASCDADDTDAEVYISAQSSTVPISSSTTSSSIRSATKPRKRATFVDGALDIFLWCVMYVRIVLYAVLGAHIHLTCFDLLRPTKCFSEVRHKSNGVGDGLISEFEQSHPCVPIHHEAPHVDLPSGVLVPLPFESVGDTGALEQVVKHPHVMRPGVWFNARLVADHCGVVPFPVNRSAQLDFFQQLFECLSVLQPTYTRHT